MKQVVAAVNDTSISSHNLKLLLLEVPGLCVGLHTINERDYRGLSKNHPRRDQERKSLSVTDAS